MKRGELWWASLGEPSGSEAGFRRPVLIVSANELNASNLRTVITLPVTGNLSREHYEMNVRLPARGTGLSAPSVVQTSIISTTNKRLLTERIGRVPNDLMARVDAGLKLVLAL